MHFQHMNDTSSAKEALNSSIVKEFRSMRCNPAIIFPQDTLFACWILSGKCKSGREKKNTACQHFIKGFAIFHKILYPSVITHEGAFVPISMLEQGGMHTRSAKDDIRQSWVHQVKLRFFRKNVGSWIYTSTPLEVCKGVTSNAIHLRCHFFVWLLL